MLLSEKADAGTPASEVVHGCILKMYKINNRCFLVNFYQFDTFVSLDSLYGLRSRRYPFPTLVELVRRARAAFQILLHYGVTPKVKRQILFQDIVIGLETICC